MPVDFFSVLGAGRSVSTVTTPTVEPDADDLPPTVAPSSHARREYARIVGYHNGLLPDEIPSETPPSYSSSQRFHAGHFSSSPGQKPEPLPAYTPNISHEGTLGMKLEMSTPFNAISQPHWAEVYVVLRGTALNIHQVKSPGFLSRVKNPDKLTNSPGKLLKSFSLQHAEIGVATDHEKVELVARSHLTDILPAHTLAQLKVTDPGLFYPVRQYVIRLRLETSQFLLRVPTSDDLVAWTIKICTAIDLAPPLEIRTEPRYHTLPRRRRRNNATAQPISVTQPSVIAQQERIIREQFPNLCNSEATPVLAEPKEDVNDGSTLAPVDSVVDSPDADAEDELDLNIVRNGPESPSEERADPMESVFRSVTDLLNPGIQDMDRIRRMIASREDVSSAALATSASDVDAENKWRPMYTYGPLQEARYQRRCLPTLCYFSKRATGVLFYNGLRVEIDYDSRVLRPYPSPPPAYGAVPSQTAQPPPSPTSTFSRLASDDQCSSDGSSTTISSRPQSVADHNLSPTTTHAPLSVQIPGRPNPPTRDLSSLSAISIASSVSTVRSIASPSSKRSWSWKSRIGGMSRRSATDTCAGKPYEHEQVSHKTGSVKKAIPRSVPSAIVIATTEPTSTAPPLESVGDAGATYPLSPEDARALREAQAEEEFVDTEDKCSASTPHEMHPALRS